MKRVYTNRNVHQLSREELQELKINWCFMNDNELSMGEMCEIDEIVSDETIFKEYANCSFCCEDFGCNFIN